MSRSTVGQQVRNLITSLTAVGSTLAVATGLFLAPQAWAYDPDDAQMSGAVEEQSQSGTEEMSTDRPSPEVSKSLPKVDDSSATPESQEAPVTEESDPLPAPLAGVGAQLLDSSVLAAPAGSLTQAQCQSQVLSLVNKERSKAGLAPVSLHAGLNSMSVMWSDWMATTKQMVHLPIKYGWQFWGAVGAGGMGSENIAGGYWTSESVMSGFMNSSGHRANILSPNAKYLGVGCSYSSGGYGIYWTQQFATATVPKTTSYDRIPIPTDQVSVSMVGGTTVGSLISASVSGDLPPKTTLKYQWSAGGVAIPGATGSSFKMTAAQSGKTISLSVTASNDPVFYKSTTLPVKAGIRQAAHWVQSGSDWYYYGANGQKLVGWVNDGSSWYYLSSPSGRMVTGWALVGGKWYYLSNTGAMATGWVSVGGKWYYMDASGAMVTGWALVGGKWYYLSASGAIMTGWVLVGGAWYYMDSSGAMRTGWITVGGKSYYLDSSGRWIK